MLSMHMKVARGLLSPSIRASTVGFLHDVHGAAYLALQGIELTQEVAIDANTATIEQHSYVTLVGLPLVRLGNIMPPTRRLQHILH